MKTVFFRQFPLIAIVMASLLYASAGIQWGLPSSTRAALVFPDGGAERLFKTMIESRDEIYRHSGGSALGRTGGQESPIMASMSIGASGNVLLPRTDLVTAQCARPYFLRTSSTDEQMTIAALSGMKPLRGDFNPRLFQYGGLYLYGMGGMFGLAHVTGIITLTSDLAWYLARPERMGAVFLAGRLVNLFFLAGTLILLWRGACVLYSRRAGYFSLLFLAFSPGLIFQAHIMKPYMAGTFFAALALYYSAKAVADGRGKSILLSAAAAGLSMAAMPLYGFSILLPLCAALLFRVVPLRKIVFIPLIFTGVFLLCNPYWLLDFSRGFQEMLGTRNMYRATQDLSSIAYFMARQFPQNFSYSFTLFLGAGIVYSVLTRRRRELFLLVCALVPLAVFAKLLSGYAASPHASRFLLPWVLILTLPAAGMLDGLCVSLRGIARSAVLSGTALLSIITVTHTAGYAVNFLADSGAGSTRMNAGRFMNDTILPGSVIGIPALPEPALTPPFAFSRYRLEIVRDPAASAADHIVVREDQFSFDQAALDKRYRLVRRFAPRDFPGWFPARFCPSHVNPAFLLYRKREEQPS